MSMHPLVHAWAKDRLDEADNVKWSTTAASILAVSTKSQTWDADIRYRRSIISHVISSLPCGYSKFFAEADGLEERLNMVANFAIVLSENNLLQESATLKERILDARRGIYGADSLEILTSVEALMVSFCSLGRYEEAVEALEDVLRKKEALLDKQHPEILRSKSVLSRVLISLGRYKEALNMQLGILEAKEHTIEQDPEISRSLEILADYYLCSGRPQEALSLAQKLLNLRQRNMAKSIRML